MRGSNDSSKSTLLPDSVLLVLLVEKTTSLSKAVETVFHMASSWNYVMLDCPQFVLLTAYVTTG